MGISGNVAPSQRGGSVRVSSGGRGRGRGRNASSTVATAGRRGWMEVDRREDLDTDDDETLSDLSVLEDDDTETRDVSRGDLAPTRRNPARASRPSTLAE